MAHLIVRNIDDALVRRLKFQAAHHGRSVEAEHREILCEALESRAEGKSIKDWLLDMPDVGEGEDFQRGRGPTTRG